MSDITGKNNKKKELRITNSCIKIYISHLSILLNFSSINFIKQNLLLSPISPIPDSANHNL